MDFYVLRVQIFVGIWVSVVFSIIGDVHIFSLWREKRKLSRMEDFIILFIQEITSKLGGGFAYSLIFIPIWGEWSNLTSIFFRWVEGNHQPENQHGDVNRWRASDQCVCWFRWMFGLHSLSRCDSEPTTSPKTMGNRGNCVWIHHRIFLYRRDIDSFMGEEPPQKTNITMDNHHF